MEEDNDLADYNWLAEAKVHIAQQNNADIAESETNWQLDAIAQYQADETSAFHEYYYYEHEDHVPHWLNVAEAMKAQDNRRRLAVIDRQTAIEEADIQEDWDHLHLQEGTRALYHEPYPYLTEGRLAREEEHQVYDWEWMQPRRYPISRHRRWGFGEKEE